MKNKAKVSVFFTEHCFKQDSSESEWETNSVSLFMRPNFKKKKLYFVYIGKYMGRYCMSAGDPVCISLF